MSWNTTAPDGTRSVKANNAILQTNTTYIETNMQLDHYWTEDANNDGHHKKVEFSDINNSNVVLDANGDPTVLSTGQNCMFYTRRKTATEQPGALQSDEPYTYVISDPLGVPVNQYMQLGFRALANFDGRTSGTGSVNGACTVNYSHNISNIYRTGTGLYTIEFTNDLPTNKYILSGSVMRSGSLAGANLAIDSDNTYGSSVDVGFVKIQINSTDAGDLKDPKNVMVMVMGG